MSQDLHAYINTVQLANPNAFEAQRKAAFEQGPAERALSFDELLAASQTIDGRPVADEVLDQVTAENAAQTAAERLARARAVSSRVLDIVFDPESTVVKGVYDHKVLPPDDKATSRQMAMAAQVGYGPKRNGSSFRMSGPVPTLSRH